MGPANALPLACGKVFALRIVLGIHDLDRRLAHKLGTAVSSCTSAFATSSYGGQLMY